MRHNGRAPLLLQHAPLDCVTLDGDEIRSVVCTDCGTWRVFGAAWSQLTGRSAQQQAD